MLYCIPYAQQTVRVPFSPQEASILLKDAVIPRQGWWDSSVALAGNFEGVVLQKKFRIQHVLGYRNSFNPVVYGRFLSNPQGTKIVIKMVMNPFVAAFCLCWFSIILSVANLSVHNCVVSGRWTGEAFAPFGMLLFGYLIASVGFGIEANKAVDFLNEVLASNKQAATTSDYLVVNN